MRYLRLVAGLVAALALAPLHPPPAYAHARPDRADPPIEGVVPTAPPVMQVWFGEGVTASGSSLQVVDAAGNRVDAGDSRVDLNDPDRKRMMVSLGQLADGVYTVNWQTVSADDGDAADGTFRFGVGASTVLPPLPAAGPAPRITIETATVSGRDVRIHVGLQGVILKDTTAADMDQSGMSNGNMAQGQMSTGMSQGTMDGGAMDQGQMADSAPASTAQGGMPEGHLHVYVDGTMLQMVYQPDITLSNVPAGTHEIRVELSDNQHRDWNPPIVATTTVVVP